MRQYHFPTLQTHPIRSRVYHLGSLQLTPCDVAPRTPEPEAGSSSLPRRAINLLYILTLSGDDIFCHPQIGRIWAQIGASLRPRKFSHPPFMQKTALSETEGHRDCQVMCSPGATQRKGNCGGVVSRQRAISLVLNWQPSFCLFGPPVHGHPPQRGNRTLTLSSVQ